MVLCSAPELDIVHLLDVLLWHLIVIDLVAVRIGVRAHRRDEFVARPFLYEDKIWSSRS
jgi:hypothetical protein